MKKTWNKVDPELKRKALQCAVRALQLARTREQGNKVRKDFDCFKDEPAFKEAIRKKRIEFNKT